MTKFLDFISSKTFRNSVCFILFTFLLAITLSSQNYFFQKVIENGISKKDIVAQKDIKVVDTKKTEQHKKEIAQNVEPILTQAEDEFIMTSLLTLQNSVRKIREKDAGESVKLSELNVLFDEADNKKGLVNFLLKSSEDTFKYYASIFKQIELAGGCVSISDYNGLDGDAANNSEFLKDMIECGKFTVDIVNEDKHGVVSFSGTSPSSDSFLGYTTTTTIDKAALAKAEAEYQHETKLLDQKDKKFDMDLSKLDTERQAVNKQIDSVKTVIKDNIDRTFGIFS